MPSTANDNDEVAAHHLKQDMMLRHPAELVAKKGNIKPIFRYLGADLEKAVR